MENLVLEKSPGIWSGMFFGEETTPLFTDQPSEQAMSPGRTEEELPPGPLLRAP